MLLYGSVDGCRSVYADKQVAAKVAALAEKLHWSESSIRLMPAETETAEKTETTGCSTPLEATEGKVAFTGPVDAKLLRGIDGHVYALDFIRSQPVDCFWIQEELKRDAQSAGSSQFILRPELIEHIITQKAELEARGQQIKELLEKKQKGEAVEVTAEQLKALEGELPMIEAAVKALPTAFDVNCFTPYSATTAAASRAASPRTTPTTAATPAATTAPASRAPPHRPTAPVSSATATVSVSLSSPPWLSTWASRARARHWAAAWATATAARAVPATTLTMQVLRFLTLLLLPLWLLLLLLLALVLWVCRPRASAAHGQSCS